MDNIEEIPAISVIKFELLYALTWNSVPGHTATVHQTQHEMFRDVSFSAYQTL